VNRVEPAQSVEANDSGRAPSVDTRETPTLTVVVPAFNEETYLPVCLEHIVAEAGRRPPGSVEMIVVDNASTDGTGDVARGFPGVRVVHEPAKGLTKARQRGFVEARGEVVAYVDADTQMPAGWLGKVADEFAGDDKVVCVSGPYVYYDQPAFGRMLVWLFWRLLAIPTYLFTGYMAVGGNFAVRRTAVEAIGGFDTTIAFYGEDTDIARRLHQVGKVRFLLPLYMLTSGRRFEAEGLVATAGRYVLNFFSEVFLGRPLTRAYTDIRPAEPSDSRGIGDRYRAFLSIPGIYAATALSAGLFIVAIFLNSYAGIYATESASNPVTDIVLSNVRVIDLDGVFIYGAFALTIFVTILLLLQPQRIPFGLAALGVFYLTRTVFISLTHIGPYPLPPTTEFGPIISKLFFGGDLFFSGHTGAPFLLGLMFWQTAWLRYVFLATSVILGGAALLAHLHYSIDVLSAFFITYTVFQIAVHFFGRQWAWFHLKL
jgi:glycosyltransferase involved in cell wall biosynthesis